MPRGSILGPFLFLFYKLTTRDVSIVNALLKSAADTKVAAVLSNKENIAQLQNELWVNCAMQRVFCLHPTTPRLLFTYLLADRTNGRAYATVLRLSLSVCLWHYVLWLNGAS